MATRREFAAPLTIAAFLALLGLYVGAYAALVEPRERLRMHPDGCCRPVREPRYRLEDDHFARRVFLPIHSLDRLARPNYWSAN